jgi:hypothetical protein
MRTSGAVVEGEGAGGVVGFGEGGDGGMGRGVVISVDEAVNANCGGSGRCTFGTSEGMRSTFSI